MKFKFFLWTTSAKLSVTIPFQLVCVFLRLGGVPTARPLRRLVPFTAKKFHEFYGYRLFGWLRNKMMADGSKENRPPPELLCRYPEVRISDFFFVTNSWVQSLSCQFVGVLFNHMFELSWFLRFFSRPIVFKFTAVCKALPFLISTRHCKFLHLFFPYFLAQNIFMLILLDREFILNLICVIIDCVDHWTFTIDCHWKCWHCDHLWSKVYMRYLPFHLQKKSTWH